MPSIMVVTHTANEGDAAVFLAERLMTVQLDDAHYAAQLVERLKWAGEDAEHAEREAAIRTHAPDGPRAGPGSVDPGLDRPVASLARIYWR
jgi:hypothetical protein